MKLKLVLLWLATVLAVPLPAQVLSNDAVVDGKTIGDWSAEWWKWIYSLPTNQSPLLDTDGSFAANGQPGGDVFFVANLARPGTAARSFTIQEGKFLLFPVRYVTLDNVDFPVPLTLEELRDTAAGVVDLMTNLHVSIDGQPVDVSTHRFSSPVFSFNFETADNLDSFIYGHPVTGLVDPIVSDGYWIMLEPLPAGTHVLSFGGEIGPPYNSSKEITDTITVAPIPLSVDVNSLIAVLEGANLGPNRLHPLRVSLVASSMSFDSGDLRSGINQLRAFQNKVRAQIARSNPPLADLLTQAVQVIMDKAAGQLP